MSETEQLIADVLETGGAELENLPPKIKRLLELLLEERKELLRRLKELEDKKEQSEEKANKNSRNSSKPPSQDAPGASQKPKKSSTGRSRGAQKGHSKKAPKLYDEADCKEIHRHVPAFCQCCGEPLILSDGLPPSQRHQYLELPEIQPEIIEHQIYELECSQCGTTTAGQLPDALPPQRYGPRLTALIAFLRGYSRQSHQMVQSFLEDVLGIEMSTGQINRLSQEASSALEVPVQEAQDYLQNQALVVGSDETSFPQRNGDGNNPQGKKGWLWAVVSPLVVFFQVTLSRSQASAQAILGNIRDSMPIIISDRYSGYNWIPLKNRQICWSHLIRDFTAMSERPGASGEVGRSFLKKQRRLFRWWHRFRAGFLSYELLVEAVKHLRRGFKAELEEVAAFAVSSKDKSLWAKTIRTCREILKVEEALWTFVFNPEVEPTNNASEQALRPAVLWRRTSYGSQSQGGSEFAARILTVTTTLKRQKRSVFQFLVDAIRAKRNGTPCSSLLPS